MVYFAWQKQQLAVQNGDRKCGVFAERQVCEKHLAKVKDVIWAFMDLEKRHMI